jgi:hypothetical protein
VLSFRIAGLSGLLLLVEAVPPCTFLLITTSCTIKTRKFISKDPTLVLLHNLVVYLFIRPGLEIGQGLPPLRGISGRVAEMVTSSIAGCLWSRNLMFEAKEATR